MGTNTSRQRPSSHKVIDYAFDRRLKGDSGPFAMLIKDRAVAPVLQKYKPTRPEYWELMVIIMINWGDSGLFHRALQDLETDEEKEVVRDALDSRNAMTLGDHRSETFHKVMRELREIVG